MGMRVAGALLRDPKCGQESFPEVRRSARTRPEQPLHAGNDSADLGRRHGAKSGAAVAVVGGGLIKHPPLDSP